MRRGPLAGLLMLVSMTAAAGPTAAGADQGYVTLDPYPDQVRLYNDGLARLRDGHDGQGRSMLDRVGRLDRSSPLMAALADQANYSLSIHLMSRGFGDAAIPVLERIGSRGRLSGPALLALGWAWLLPSPEASLPTAEVGDERSIGPPPETFGGQQDPIGDHNLYQRHRLQPLARQQVPAEWQARGQRALAVWSRLLDRDEDDPALPMGMMAMADVLAAGGAAREALHLRERAMDSLDLQAGHVQQARRMAATATWIDRLLAPVAGEPLDGEWQLRRLPASVLGAYLGEALAEPRFQATLQGLAGGSVPNQWRAGPEPRPASTGEHSEPDTRRPWSAAADREGRYRRLQALAEETLCRREADIDHLRIELRLKIARQHDATPLADGPEAPVRPPLGN